MVDMYRPILGGKFTPTSHAIGAHRSDGQKRNRLLVHRTDKQLTNSHKALGIHLTNNLLPTN